jgi:hypothetical protein
MAADLVLGAENLFSSVFPPQFCVQDVGTPNFSGPLWTTVAGFLPRRWARLQKLDTTLYKSKVLSNADLQGNF